MNRAGIAPESRRNPTRLAAESYALPRASGRPHPAGAPVPTRPDPKNVGHLPPSVTSVPPLAPSARANLSQLREYRDCVERILLAEREIARLTEQRDHDLALLPIYREHLAESDERRAA